MRPFSCSATIVFLAALLGIACSHTRPQQPVCQYSPEHPPTRNWTSPTPASPGWGRALSVDTANCSNLETFMVEGWRDFNPADEDHRRILIERARSHRFDPRHYTVSQMVDVIMLQAVYEGTRPQSRRLNAWYTVDGYNHDQLPEPNWWRRLGLKLKVRVRNRHIPWNLVCRSANVDQLPDISTFHEGWGVREMVEMRLGTECDHDDVTINYDHPGAVTPPTAWNVYLSRSIIDFIAAPNSPLEQYLVRRRLISQR